MMQSQLVEPIEIAEPGILADDVAGAGLLDMFARELGYDDVVIVSCLFCKPSRKLAKPDMSKWYALRSRMQYGYSPIATINGLALGCRLRDGYADAARDVHSRLENGEWLMAGDRKFKAEDVPRFMLECVLAGLV